MILDKIFIKVCGEKGMIFLDIISFLRKTFRYNASFSTMGDKEKAQYTLLRRTHIIEKGMSLRNPRKGFGMEKVDSLLDDLLVYFNKFGDSNFFNYPVSALSDYLNYTNINGVEAKLIAEKLSILKGKLNFSNKRLEKSGINIIKKNEIMSSGHDFKNLLYNRHSLRFFTDEIVPKEKIIEALELAQRTPSACNRQGWKTHVFYGEDAVNLARWQGGSRGFEEEIHCAILVTANLKAFLSHEMHQAYVDGGLYAMNLLNALTYKGMGTIPLSCGFHENKLKNLSKFEIPNNEIPILIIGVGEYEDEMKVAVSKRKSLEDTNTFHKLQ